MRGVYTLIHRAARLDPGGLETIGINSTAPILFDHDAEAKPSNHQAVVDNPYN